MTTENTLKFKNGNRLKMTANFDSDGEMQERVGTPDTQYYQDFDDVDGGDMITTATKLLEHSHVPEQSQQKEYLECERAGVPVQANAGLQGFAASYFSGSQSVPEFALQHPRAPPRQPHAQQQPSFRILPGAASRCSIAEKNWQAQATTSSIKTVDTGDSLFRQINLPEDQFKPDDLKMCQKFFQHEKKELQKQQREILDENKQLKQS